MNCSVCSHSKAPYKCGICESSICKTCAFALESQSFELLESVPAALNHPHYCQSCYYDHVAGPLAEYEDLRKKAEDVLIYEKHQGKETRLVKRKERPMQVGAGEDYQQTLMRLAFQAAQANFNALVDVEIKHQKIHDEAYQTKVWSASGIPVNVELHGLAHRPTPRNPN